MNLGWRKQKSEPDPAAEVEPVIVQLDTDELQRMSAVFAAPRWLRDLGIASWFLVGVGFLLVGIGRAPRRDRRDHHAGPDRVHRRLGRRRRSSPSCSTIGFRAPSAR